MAPYLVDIARRRESIPERGTLKEVADKLEPPYGALDSDRQDSAAELMSWLRQQMECLG